jgi:hypothetical protein
MMDGKTKVMKKQKKKKKKKKKNGLMGKGVLCGQKRALKYKAKGPA